MQIPFYLLILFFSNYIIIKKLIMKKFFLSTNMVALFVFITISTNAQQKQVMTAAKKAASPITAAVPIKADIAPAPVNQSGSVTDIIAGSKVHTTLLAALKAAGLVEALQGTGPFTVFAPTNDAFAKIPTATLDNLLKPESKDALSKTLTAHVISGNITAEDVLTAIKTGNGTASYTSLGGEKLTATAEGGRVKLTDAAGNAAYVSTANLTGTNGVVHVIDAVLGK
jgi:uncharacterized surface protein with fasciclin (FAS1) repeats